MPSKLLDASPTKRAWDAVNDRRKKLANIQGITASEAHRRGFGTQAMSAPEMQRALRNAQSRISKDIRATERDFAKLSDKTDPTGQRRQAAREYLGSLRALREDMKASTATPAGKVVHTSGMRLRAMERYLGGFAGKENRAKALAGMRVRYRDSEASAFERNFRDKYDFDFNPDDSEYAGDYRLQDLYDDYEQAIVAGSSDEAREIMRTIRDYLDDFYDDRR